MKLEILSFTWKLFTHEDVVSINVMTKAWEITILNNHSALVASLVPSVIKIRYIQDSIKKEEDFAIWTWILETSHSQVKILIDMLVSVDEIDVNYAEQAKQNALNLLEKYKNAKDKVDMDSFIEAEDNLLKSVAQLKLYELR